MAYMTRLGLWGAGTTFTDFNHFIQAIEQRGVGAMELVAMDMKLRGMYIARQLSFSGVHFSILDVPLTDEYLQTYDRSVQLVKFEEMNSSLFCSSCFSSGLKSKKNLRKHLI